MQPNQPYQPAPPPSPAPNGPHPPEYGFIMDPQKPPRRKVPNLSGTSLAKKVAIIGGGALFLLIFFLILRGLFFSGSGKMDAFVTVAQSQQEIIHLTEAAQQQENGAGLSAANQNFAVTAKVTVTSAQGEVLTYMATNGKKVKSEDLAKSVSTTTDQELASAAQNSTYNATFKKVMQTELGEYQTAMQQAYKQAGPKGRELLDKQYKGSQLLVQQLNTPGS